MLAKNLEGPELRNCLYLFERQRQLLVLAKD